MNSSRYVTFLRGINVGGNALIQMSELKASFESLGFKKVVTVLASGNVVFDAVESQPTAVLRKKIEERLSRQFKLQPTVTVRTAEQVLELVKLNPFKGTRLGPETKLQITFLPMPTRQKAKFPILLADDPFQVIQISPSEICSAVDLSSDARTPELMKFLEKQFGKSITTRTWETIARLVKLLSAQ